MINVPQSNLRERLRRETRASHTELDRMVAQFDLLNPIGLACFLGMQVVALHQLASLSSKARCQPLMDTLQLKALEDMGTLSVIPPTVNFGELAQLHPLAVDYVVAGSRLGTQVLKKRWQAATDPLVNRANVYFSAPDYLEYWSSFCHTSKRVAGDGPTADGIVQDAIQIFQLYQISAETAREAHGAIHA